MKRGYAIKLTCMWMSASVSAEKYGLRYAIGKSTQCVPGTLGIFCFDSIKNASKFINFNFVNGGHHLSLVKGSKKKDVPARIPLAYTFDIDKYYTGNCLCPYAPRRTPTGTICYESVKVIRELTQEEIQKGEILNGYQIIRCCLFTRMSRKK